MKKCPHCAEEIQDNAIKCKHCGSDLLPKEKVKARNHPSYWTFTLLAFLLAGVGIIVGIVYLCKKDPLDKKLGEHTLVFSILSIVFWSMLLSLGGLMGGSDYTSSQNILSSTPTASLSGGTYQEVFNFSGKGTKKSESFVIKGSKFKIKYDCSGDLCQAFLYNINTGMPDIVMNAVGSTTDETIFYGRGEYYIEANTLGSYTMTVEDYR